MISPLLQSPGTPPDPRLLGDPQGSQDPGYLFAQLLGTAPPASLPSPVAGTESEPIAISVPESAIEQQQQQPPPDADEVIPAPLARVFNQDGFFGHALGRAGANAGIPEIAGAAPELPSGMVEAYPGAGAGAVPSPPEAHTAIVKGLAPGTAGASAPAMRLERGGTHLGAVPTPTRPMTAPPIAEAGDEGQAPEVHPLHRQFRTVFAGQSPVAVAVGEVEQGLRVTAHVAGLDETERRQLRDAISALLARHGLTGARIQINAEPTLGINA